MNQNDSSNVLAVLAAALAPYLAQHLGGNGVSNGGNPAAQAGGTFGSPQTGGALNTAFTGQQNQNASTAQNAQANMFGGTAQVAQAQPSVTPDMIQQLITPLVQNEQVKQALTQQMQQMGIQNLPDARPDQLAELYQRFQQVDTQARQAGLIGGGAAQGGAAPSII